MLFFFFNVQPCVTASTERVMDVKTTCLQTKNCNEIIFTLGKRGLKTCQVKNVQVLVQMNLFKGHQLYWTN